jgi:hypothetical protein
MAETMTTAERFQSCREEIYDLYVVQDKKLTEVMSIMAQRGLEIE